MGHLATRRNGARGRAPLESRIVLAVLASSVFIVSPLASASPPQGRTLTLDQRIAAQKAIEQVYWKHRIWPKENPIPKPPLSAVMSDEVIRARVEDGLKKSNALEKFWQRPVTSEQLQAEMDRMAKNTRDGKTLNELYRALGNDPLVIAETLARETLVDRLIRNWYSSDTRFHGELKAKAEAARAACASIDCTNTLGGEYHEATWKLRTQHAAATAEIDSDNVMYLDPEQWKSQREHLAATLGAPADALPTGRLTGLEETPEAFLVTAVRTQREGELVTVGVAWPKRSFDEWWTSERDSLSAAIPQTSGTLALPDVPSTTCTNDTWSPTRTGVPDPRYKHTAVWTGVEMIVWGGNVVGLANTNSGGRYDPATDSWTSTSTGANAPGARAYHTAVWTGTEMIVWGGSSGSPRFNTGGRYNPETDTWTATSTGFNVPAARDQHAAVWTGTEMIVWGGYNGSSDLNTGGRYDPSGDSWTMTSTGTNAPAARRGHTAVWAGARMVVWGGFTGFTGYWNTGARYDPSNDSWTSTSTGAGVPTARGYHSAAWTGTEMIVWGGSDGSSDLNTGGRYNPSADTWTATSTGANVAAARREHSAVWSGTEMIVWGGYNGSYLSTGGKYKPTTDTWTATSTGPNVPLGCSLHSAVWTGTEMIVWGGYRGPAGFNTGGRYNPSSDSWTPTSTGGSVAAARFQHTAIWTGTEMIVWGGVGGGNSDVNTGARYNPSVDSWTATAMGANVPAYRDGHTAVWTGLEMIVWGGYNSSTLNTGGRYDPSNDAWVPTSTGPNVPSGRRAHTAVWTGTEMIIWGGYSGSSKFKTGGRYDTASDAWTATSTGANVPTARYGHTAVWTGTEMIVWGGTNDVSWFNSGGRYNPTSDGWNSTSTGATARYWHNAVWTGMEMIVWGGMNQSGGVLLNSGGRYTPSSDAWAATSTGASVPTAREMQTAVWTGTEMIVWGGYVGSPGDNTGGRYNPTSDAWTSTSTEANVPTARYGHTAVWTGTEMIVWGGTPTTSSGARYCACPSGRIVYRDADGDGYGDPSVSISSCDGIAPAGYVADYTDCNDASASAHPGAAEICDGIDNDCNGLVDESASGEDSDGDGIHDACDNCPFAANATQSDADHNGEGDACDLADGLIYVFDTSVKSNIQWQQETGYDAWNVYTGDLSVLRASGTYTQAPGSNPLASKSCGLTDLFAADPLTPEAGHVEFSLVTGVAMGIEGTLGTNSHGVTRPNANPCP